MTDIKQRTIYFFKCTNCKKGRRSTLKDYVAENGICRKCKKLLAVDKNQLSMFEEPNHANAR